MTKTLLETFTDKLTASGIRCRSSEVAGYYGESKYQIELTKNVEGMRLEILVGAETEQEVIKKLLLKLASISGMIHDVNREFVASELVVNGVTGK